MLAFHSDPIIKTRYLLRVAAHRAADQLIQGTGWEHGKGCAIGCTLDGYDHDRYPIELGIPIRLAHLEDRLFELQSPADAQLWPERFLFAIRPGADLMPVWGQWAVWMLVDPEWGVIRHAKRDDARAVIQCVADLWRNGGTPEQFRQAARQARTAADDAAAYAAIAADVAAAASYAAAAASYAWRQARARWASAACDKLIALLEAA